MFEYIKEFATSPAVVLFGAITLVEFTPIKINPWKAIFAWIGSAINGELFKKVDNLDLELKDLRNVCDERNATLNRTHILHFNDEILHQKEHTKEHFDQILDDITNYESYCKTHPEYKNNKAVCAIDNIKNTYKKCMDKNNFL